MGNKVDKVTGKVKEKLGEVTGSDKLQAEGKAEQVAGEDDQSAEDFREAVKGERRPD